MVTDLGQQVIMTVHREMLILVVLVVTLTQLVVQLVIQVIQEPIPKVRQQLMQIYHHTMLFAIL